MTRFVLPDVYAQKARAVPSVQHEVTQPARAFPVARTAPARLTLQVGASFGVLDAQGNLIRLSQKKGRLMLAMVGCTPGMKRSRDWLRRHLWHRSFTSHGFSSLRQCLHNLRLALGPQGNCLCADRDFVWLEDTRIDWGESLQDPALFLEDAPRLDGPAQNWLDRERARLRAGLHCARD